MRICTIIATLLAFVVSAPAAAAQLLPLAVRRNQIIRAGVPFNFYGVNRDSLEWGDGNWSGCGGDGHWTDADFDHIAAWRATVVRIPLSQANWLGRRCRFSNYPAMIDAAIAKATARGMYVVLELHWNDVRGMAPCDAQCVSGEQQMPDSDSISFWRQVAARYANNPGVIFGLFNEPHYVSWSCWLSGGCWVQADTSGSGNPGSTHPWFRAVGIQTLYNAVRSTGARNLVMVPGLDWGYDLLGVNSGYALNGYNIVYDSHIYVHWHNTQSDLDAHVGDIAKHYPVAVMELGTTDCSSDTTRALLNYLYTPEGIKADRISWAIWGWNSPGECNQPSILADWSGTPLQGQGQLIHDALAVVTAPNAEMRAFLASVGRTS